jgi:hypothetical protein
MSNFECYFGHEAFWCLGDLQIAPRCQGGGGVFGGARGLIGGRSRCGGAEVCRAGRATVQPHPTSNSILTAASFNMSTLGA